MNAAIVSALLSLAAYLLPLVVEGLKAYSEKQKGGNADANIQEYREALAKNNIDRIAALDADQHDRVLAEIRGG